MNLFKTSFWSAISTTVKILAGIVTTKIMAIYIGPAGVALLGNFNNMISIFSTFSNGAITSGITKYISEYKTDEEKRNVTAHSLKITLICSLIIGLCVIALRNSLARIAFGDTQYSSVFVVLGFTVFFFGLNTTITSVLNGYREIKVMIVTGIVGSVLSVILAFFITIKYGLFGALINVSIAQVFIFLINVLLIRKLKLIDLDMLKLHFDRDLLWKLFKYSTMSIVSIMVVPTSTLMIRKYVYSNFSPNEAGYIQGMWSISAAYLTIITTTLSIYYLPTLSSIHDDFSLRKEIMKGYKFILPLAVFSGAMIFLCKDIIIYVLYSPEFLPMKKYFLYQIIGDTFKIASWILAFLMIAKAMTRVYIITEIVFAFLNVCLSLLFMKLFGSVGVMYGYILNYFVYLITLLVIFRKLLFYKGMSGSSVKTKEEN